MSGGRLRKRWILIVGVLLVASVDFLVWRIYSGHHSPRWRLASSSSATRHDRPELDDDLPELSRGPAGDAAAEPQIETRGDTGTGSIRIHVHDAASGEAIVGATCVVYAERHGQYEYGVVETDHEGLATLGNLPENTILVHVLRSPPHASGYGGVWLRDGATRDVDVKLTAGGTVFGRALDDTGHPIAGADVRFESEPWMPKSLEHVEPAAVARTDDEGRFEIPNVISDPESVWIVHGEMRPEYWGSVAVRVGSGITSGTAETEVADCTRVDLGDIVIPRSCTYSGRVLDARHAPVEGAHIEVEDEWSTQFRRELPTSAGETAKALQTGCARTDASGGFSIECMRPSPQAAVTTREGLLQSFTLPGIAPGGRANDIELVLDESSLLVIELVDESGARVVRAAATVKDVEFPNKQYPSSDEYSSNLQALLTLGDEIDVSERIRADSDWLFRVQTRRTAGVPRRLHLDLCGYSSVDEDIGVQRASVEHLRFTVHPLPCVRVHVRVAEQPRGAPASPRLTLRACLLDPTQRARDTSDQRCCGQGSIWCGELNSANEDVTVPVLGPGTYWIYARVPVPRPPDSWTEHAVWTRWEKHFGPFAADGIAHEIEIPPLAAEEFTKRDSDDEPKPEPPEPSAPDASESKIRSTVMLHVIDEATKAGIDRAFVHFCVPGSTDYCFRFRTENDGRLREAQVEPGKYDLLVSAYDHRSCMPVRVQIRAGEVADLGTITLGPPPSVRIRIVESDGTPAPRGTVLKLCERSSEGWTSDWLGDANEDGTSEVRKELGPACTICVREPRGGSDGSNAWGEQWLKHDFDPNAPMQEIRLKPWHSIEIRIDGAIQSWPAAFLSARLVPVDAADLGPEHIDLVQLLLGADGTRRFRCAVGGVGSWRVVVDSPLLQPFSQTIDIQDHADVQTFLLTPIR